MANYKRKRKTRQAPLCPAHEVAMLVGRVIGPLQYRYCPVAGCRESAQTLREEKQPVPALSPAAPELSGEGRL